MYKKNNIKYYKYITYSFYVLLLNHFAQWPKHQQQSACARISRREGYHLK